MATPFYIRDTGAPGPTVLLVAGMHGDEPAGPAALDQIRHWPIRCGKLVVLPRLNIVALNAKTRRLPSFAGTNRFDLNRAFPPDTGRADAAAELAGAVWSFVRELKPDWLLDLHEGTGFRAITTNSVGSSVIACTNAEARRAAELMLATLNRSITNADHRFVLLRQPVKGSLARAAADKLGIRALILETTTRSQPLALRARQHRIAVHTLLRELKMFDESVMPEQGTDAAAAER